MIFCILHFESIAKSKQVFGSNCIRDIDILGPLTKNIVLITSYVSETRVAKCYRYIFLFKYTYHISIQIYLQCTFIDLTMTKSRVKCTACFTIAEESSVISGYQTGTVIGRFMNNMCDFRNGKIYR